MRYDLGKVVMRYRGELIEGQEYTVGDTAKYRGSLWLCTSDTNHAPTNISLFGWVCVCQGLLVIDESEEAEIMTNMPLGQTVLIRYENPPTWIEHF